MGKSPRIRTDLAITLFLSEQGRYEGGELMVSISTGHIAVKLPRDDGVIYPASTVHHFNPVTRGERLAAMTWVQSHVRDPVQRE
jgi:PKHD-type hydroxylase